MRVPELTWQGGSVAEIVLDGITKRYGSGDAPAVNALDLEINDGEFMVFVGPS